MVAHIQYQEMSMLIRLNLLGGTILHVMSFFSVTFHHDDLFRYLQ